MERRKGCGNKKGETGIKMTAESHQVWRRNSEGEPKAEPAVRVYPMGFIPDIKRQLLEGAEAALSRQQILSRVGQRLRVVTEGLKQNEIELHEFLEIARGVSELVQDGEMATQRERDFITHVLRTDEEIAVIFAKISRNPGSFEEIARSVTEEGAARFHQKWTVSVEGYGHASVAEHAVIHMAVENIPSLDGDWVTDNRLASFTEFSARFKGAQDVGYFTPESVGSNPYLLGRWNKVHALVFATYEKLMEKGIAYINSDEARRKHPDRRVNTKQVADQFKNLMPASRLTSIGVTLNARETESAIRKMLSSPYSSIRQLGALFKEQGLRVAPTLVKYADRSEYMVAARRGISAIIEERRYQGYVPEITEHGTLVDLIGYDPDAEVKFIAAAVYERPETGSMRDLLEKIKGADPTEREAAVAYLLGQLGRWDIPIRDLEFAGDYFVEFPAMTYGDWREYKRHRVQSYKVKDLDVRWGFMIPPLAFEMDESEDSQFHGAVEAIKRALGEVDRLFIEVAKVDPYAAHYAVTRLHYRPAIARFNVREAYHLINLRTGPTAHPFIRRLIWPLFDQIKSVHPVLMEHLRFRLEREDRPSRDFVWTF